MIDQASENPKPPLESEGEKTVPFQCRICGECCSSFNIPIEAARAKHLLTRDWARQRLALTRRELVRVTDALYRIPLTDKNVCVFLAENNYCMIEQHEGRDAKPSECRNFPFAAVQMPDGEVAYDTSANCKNVAEKLLLAFGPIVPAEGEAPVLETSPFPVRVKATPFRSIEAEQYKRYLANLRVVFEQSDITPPEALQGAWALLHRGELPPTLTLPGEGGGDKQRPYSDNDLVRGEIRHFKSPPQWLERAFVLLFLRKPYGVYSWFTLLAGLPYADSRVFGEPVDLKGQPGVEIPADCHRLMNAFLYSLLQRKVLLTRGYCLADVLGLTVVAYWLVRWYARTLAHITGRQSVNQDDLSMAIRLCERYYTGHQPRFLAYFSRLHRGWCIARLALTR